MSESKLSQVTTAIIKTLGGHASRVESAESAAGIPDIDFCVDGIEGHIELKYGHMSKRPELRPSQVRWFRSRIRAGGKPFFLCLNDDTDMIYMVEGAHYDVLKGGKPIENWRKLATRTWRMGDEFKQELSKYIRTGK